MNALNITEAKKQLTHLVDREESVLITRAGKPVARLVPADRPADIMEPHGDGYRIRGSRVSLDSIVCAHLAGQTPESIQESFPTLSLAQTYGAISFYLSHRDEVDRQIARTEQEGQALRARARQADPAFYEKFAQAATPAKATG